MSEGRSAFRRSSKPRTIKEVVTSNPGRQSCERKNRRDGPKTQLLLQCLTVLEEGEKLGAGERAAESGTTPSTCEQFKRESVRPADSEKKAKRVQNDRQRSSACASRRHANHSTGRSDPLRRLPKGAGRIPPHHQTSNEVASLCKGTRADSKAGFQSEQIPRIGTLFFCRRCWHPPLPPKGRRRTWTRVTRIKRADP